MGTETIYAHFYILHIFKPPVKFIDPLMGTETLLKNLKWLLNSMVLVKFIDPLMGTETSIDMDFKQTGNLKLNLLIP